MPNLLKTSVVAVRIVKRFLIAVHLKKKLWSKKFIFSKFKFKNIYLNPTLLLYVSVKFFFFNFPFSEKWFTELFLPSVEIEMWLFKLIYSVIQMNAFDFWIREKVDNDCLTKHGTYYLISVFVKFYCKL